jgi:hypothetical protein
MADNSARPVQGQDGRLKLEPNDNLMTPYPCLQLAKAIEWLYHAEDEERVKLCIPKDVKKYEGRGYDTKFFETAIKQHITAMTNDTISKALPLAKMLVLENSNSADFQAAMRGTDQDALYWFRDHITDDHTYYLFSGQWKAISYDFIHHRGVRPNPAEETLRAKLYRFTRLCAAQILHNWYRYEIKLSASPGMPDEPDEAVALAYVVSNYKAVVGWSAFSSMIFKLAPLPAAPNFTAKKQVRKEQAEVSLPDGNWSD